MEEVHLHPEFEFEELVELWGLAFEFQGARAVNKKWYNEKEALFCDISLFCSESENNLFNKLRAMGGIIPSLTLEKVSTENQDKIYDSLLKLFGEPKCEPEVGDINQFELHLVGLS